MVRIRLPLRMRKVVALFMILIFIFAVFTFWKMPDMGQEEEKGEEFFFEGWPPQNSASTARDNDNNEPTIAFDPTDPMTIVTASNDYNTPTGDAWVGYSTSHDGGATWTEDHVPGYPGSGVFNELTGFRGGGDPVLATSSDGIFYLSGIAFKRSANPLNPVGFGYNVGRASCIFVARSTDHGDSFDHVRVVWFNMQNLVNFNDKEWIAVDPNNGNVYIVWAIFTGLALAQMYFSRSTDQGDTWSTPQIITETQGGEFGVQGSAIVVDSQSNVHVTWIDFNTNQVRYTKSLDEGRTFADPVDIAPIDPIPRYLPNGNYRTPTMTMLDVDETETESNGYLYCVWGDLSEGDSDAFLVYSHDNGENWGDPVRVNNDTAGNGLDQFFPDVVVSQEGWVHVTFYDRRNDTNNTMLEYWWAISFDHGETFEYNYPLSDASFNGDYSRDNDNDFIGDYTSVETINRTIGAVWCDTREGSETDGDTEIYFVAFDYLEALDFLGVEHPDPEITTEETPK